MTLDDAIVAFGQLTSDDFDSLELDVRDYKRLVKWLTELKLARESAFSDIGLAARAVSENSQLKAENAKLREDLAFERSENGWAREFLNRMGRKCGSKDCPSLVAYVNKLEDENAKLRELVRDMWTYITEPVSKRNNLKERLARLDDIGDRMRELGIEAVK